MRDELTVNSTMKKLGNTFCIPIRKSERDLLEANDGDDLEVHIVVRQRKGLITQTTPTEED